MILEIIFVFFIFLLVALFFLYNYLQTLVKENIQLRCERFGNLTMVPEIKRVVSDTFEKSQGYNLLVNAIQTGIAVACNQPFILPIGFDSVKVVEGTDPFSFSSIPIAFIYTSNSLNLQVVTFTPTIDLSEWITNLDVSQVAPTNLNGYGEGDLVHQGYYDMYDSIREKLALSPTFQTIFNGHSLGGALATLAYYDWVGRLNNAWLYTFGSPRTGNVSFANKIKGFRVYNTEDDVPAFPPPILEKKYYQQYKSEIDFTLNLKNESLNHNEAYLQWLST